MKISIFFILKNLYHFDSTNFKLFTNAFLDAQHLYKYENPTQSQFVISSNNVNILPLLFSALNSLKPVQSRSHKKLPRKM